MLILFYSYGEGRELSKTLKWVYNVILHRAYIDGTRHYSSDSILFLQTRLLAASDSPDLDNLRLLLKERVHERTGSNGDAFALAMRGLTCLFVDIKSETDLCALLLLQREDGGWLDPQILFWNQIGNRGFTTALEVQAIEDTRKL